MRNRIGPPVEGTDFIGKTKELAFAWELITDGNSLLLAAPRRVGKTSFAKKLVEKAKDEKWRTLELNLEGSKTEQAFIITFINALKKTKWWRNISNTITNKMDTLLNNIDVSVELGDVKTNIAWKSQKIKIFKELETLFDHSKDTLIFIDELGVLLNKYEEQDDIQGAEFLLNWFRSIRQISKTKIRWIFCSSIGVKNFTSRHKVSYTINDIEPFGIEAFDEKTAKTLIQNLATSKKITISDEMSNVMLAELEWYLPYFIQLLFKEVYQLQYLTELEINQNLIQQAFEKLSQNSHLDTWDERLKYYYNKEDTARKILNHIATIEGAATRKQLFNLVHNIKNTKEYTTDLLGDTLRLLINDGYLMQDKDAKFRFRSPLLKKYWYNKFIK